MITWLMAIACVLGITTGQLLFKLSAEAMNRAGTYLDFSGLVILAVSLVLYGITTLGWVWVLQKLPLGRVYPLMAMAFVLVPMASHFLLGERFTNQYFVGVAFIVIGIAITMQS